MRPNPRRARRAAFVLLALVLATPAARAHAQPACAAGTAADYTAEGFSCRLGAWILSDFSYYSEVVATGGATGAVPGAEGVSLSPFVHHGASGVTTFGFDFGGFAASVDGNGTMEPNVFADASIDFSFYLTAADPHVGLAGGRVRGAESVTGAPRPGDPWGGVEAGILGDVVSIFPSSIFDRCLNARVVANAAADDAVDRSDVCELNSLPRDAAATLDIWSQVSGGPPTGEGGPPLVAGVRTSATRLELSAVDVAAVPEPATVALLGGGLLLLGAAATRRGTTLRR